MPKCFLVLDHASFSKLPNIKPDLKVIEEMANKHVDDEGERFENAVIHRRRATLSGPLTEMRVRPFGDDEDLFGFILLGAYQDARPEKLRCMTMALLSA